jgi:hypothetical protein
MEHRNKSIVYLIEKEVEENFSSDSRDLRNSILQRIAKECKNNPSIQEELGNDIIVEFIVKNLNQDGVNSATLTESALWAWIRLCRREILDKSTRNMKNCDLSAQHIPTVLNTLSSNIGNSEVCYLIASMIMILASDSSERQLKLGQAGAPTLVVQVLHQHQNNSVVTEMICRASRNLSVHDEVAAMLIQEGIGEELNIMISEEGLKQSNHSIEVIEAILYVIINLSYDTNISLILGSNGVVMNLVYLISLYRKENTIINLIVWAMRNLTPIKSNILLLKYSKYPEYLLEILTIHSHDPDTIQSAIWSIANLSRNVALAKRFIEIGVIAVLAKTFQFGEDNYDADHILGPIAEAMVFTITNMSSATEFLRKDMKEAKPTDNSGEEDDHTKVAEKSPPIDLSEEFNEVDLHQIELNLKLAITANGGAALLTKFLTKYGSRDAMVENISRVIAKLAQPSLPEDPTNTTVAAYTEVRHLFANYPILEKLLAAQAANGRILETVYLSWKAIHALFDNTTKEHNHIMKNQHLPQLAKQVANAMFLHRQYEEIAKFGLTLLIESEYYLNERLEELTAAGNIDLKEAAKKEEIYHGIVLKPTVAEVLDIWGLADLVDEELKEEERQQREKAANGEVDGDEPLVMEIGGFKG